MIITILIFLAVFAVIVFSHELGHFLAARKSGMRVWEFGFGFPPKLFGVYRDPVTKKFVFVGKNFDKKKAPATLYSFNLLPIGGFVAIKGEDGQEIVDTDSFNAGKTWKKATVVVAGVIMNFLLAGVLLSLGLMIGLPSTAGGDDDKYISDKKLQIVEVLPERPAAKAELKAGDMILKIDALENPGVEQMQNYTDSSGEKTLKFTIRRGQEVFEKDIVPTKNEETGRYGIGVGISETGTVRYPWYMAIYRGFATAGIYLWLILVAFWNLISGIFAGNGVPQDISGPVGIAVMTGQVAKLGFAYLINFTALLSLNLAVFNILPLPALDGGRLLFLLLGKLNKKINFDKYENTAHGIGFILLMVLVVVVTVRDLGNFKGFFIDLFNKIF